MMARLLRGLLSADSYGFLLVFVALQALSYGVASSLRSTNTSYLGLVCLIAALIGFCLSKSKLNGVQASIALLALGVIGIWIISARLAAPLLDLVRAVLALVPQIVPAIREEIRFDTHAVGEAWSLIGELSNTLAERWQRWFVGVNQDIVMNDALIRSMIWTLILWLIAAWTGWFARRRNAVVALLPQVILLAAVISYSENKIESLWLTVFILLLLMGLWNYKNHTIQWEHRKVDYSDSIRYDSTQAVLVLAVSIGILAFAVPSMSWRQIRDYFKNRNASNQAAEILGIEPQKVPVKKTLGQTPVLPREHLLTQGFEQSQELVMTIRTGELPPTPTSTLAGAIPRYYWRNTIYDEYTGAGWVTAAAPAQNYKASTPLVAGLLDRYRPLHLDVQVERPEGKLFWSGILYSADVPFRAAWRVRPQSSLFIDQTALLQADLFHVATSATSYRVDALVPSVTVQDLRNASTEYPDYIRSHYLRLPPTVPERVHQLAERIVSGVDNPYDKAKAIESYLRTNYPYNLDVPVPPQDQDVADYFLFDLKKGYCDYYATAMVVLARSSGLPARFVSGYSSGAYDAPNAQYVVRELNAHSWPEIYFPEIGWVEFEPTGSQPVIERPEKEIELAAPGQRVTPVSRVLFQLTSERVLYTLIPIAIVLILIVFYFLLFEQMLYMSLAPQTAIERLYRRVYRLGRPLAGKSSGAETAYEFTQKMISTIQTMTSNSSPIHSSMHVQKNIQQLTSIYYSSLFSTHAPHKHDVRAAFQIWRSLRWSLLWMKIQHWFWTRNKATRYSY